MTDPGWCVVVVRAWREGDGLRVRLIGTGAGSDRTAVEFSAADASRRLRAWLTAMTADDGDEPETED